MRGANVIKAESAKGKNLGNLLVEVSELWLRMPQS
jgi:hypothetical protein